MLSDGSLLSHRSQGAGRSRLAKRSLLSIGSLLSHRSLEADRSLARRSLLSDGSLGAGRAGPTVPTGLSGRPLRSRLAGGPLLARRPLGPGRSWPPARPGRAGGAGRALRTEHRAGLCDHYSRRLAALDPGAVGDIRPTCMTRRQRQNKAGRQG